MMALQRTVLFESELLSVRYVACRSAQKEASGVEYSEADTLVMPLRGAFIQHLSARNQVLAEPNVGLLFPTGRAYRVSHPVSGDDDSLAIDIFQGHLFNRKTSLGTHGLLSPSAMAARNLLFHRLRRKIASSLEAEEAGLMLLSSVIGAVREQHDGSRKIKEQIEASQLAILQNPEQNWTLTTLGREVECSPFHLTRMFRSNVGVPLHRYHLCTRITRGLDLILNTNQEITTIALDLGFSSHSHFTAVFRRLVGMSPSEFRASANSEKAANARKILIARVFARA